MNLSILKQELSKIDINDLEIKFDPTIVYPDEHGYLFRDLINYREQLQILKILGLEEDNISAIEYYLKSSESQEVLSKDIRTGKNILDLSQSIKIGIEKIKLFLNTLPLDIDPDETVRIKIPESNDFSDMAFNLNELKKAISIPIRHPDINGNVKILTGEPGSVWLVVYLFAQKAVKVVADIVWSSQFINNKRLEGKLFEQHLRSLELDNNQKEIYQEAQRKLIEKFVDVEISGIVDRNNINADPEYKNTLRMSILTMEELYSRGAQVRPTLGAPEDILNSFPTLDSKRVLESKVKQLEEGGEKPEN